MCPGRGAQDESWFFSSPSLPPNLDGRLVWASEGVPGVWVGGDAEGET